MNHRVLPLALLVLALAAAPAAGEAVPPKAKGAPAKTPMKPATLIHWAASFEEAKAIGLDADAPVILYIYMSNDPACLDFEQKVFADATFRKLAGLFVMARAEGTRAKDVVDAFQVTRYPTLVYLDSAGEKVYRLDADVSLRQVLNRMGRSFLLSMYHSGKRARAAGDIRTAIRRYRTLMVVGEGTPPSAWAQKEMDSIAAEALKRFSQAQIALDLKDTLKGMTLLDEVVYQYRGTEAGLDAKKMLDKLSEDPKSAEVLKEVDRRRSASRELALAKKRESKKDLEEALITYWDVARDYPKTPAAEEAGPRAEELAKDKDLAARAAAARMKRDCEHWLELAASFELNKQRDKALEYYKRIIDTYPDSPYAQKAKDALGGK